MNKVIEYIKKELGQAIGISSVNTQSVKGLPSFLTSMYRFFHCKINGQSVTFAKYASANIIAPSNYKKHEKILQQLWHQPVVFVFEHLQSYNKPRISALGLNFIVPDSQIYMPDLLVVIKKTPKSQTATSGDPLSPTAQTVLLHYLYGNDNDLTFRQIQDALKMPYPTVCRAIESLANANLCSTVGSRTKTIHFDDNKTELLQKALPLMKTPVQRVVFSDIIPNKTFKSGITALAEQTMLNPDEYKHLAISKEDLKGMDTFSDDDNYRPIHIEVWSYKPELFAQNGIVDPISLYLSMKDNTDERVKHELEQLIEKIW